jgi:hypothetical protein
MATAATYVWRPSTARVALLDTFIPVPRGATSGPVLPLTWAAKDPGDVLDYTIDFSPAFVGNPGDTIADLEVAISPSQPGDLTINRASADGTSAVLWLGAGQAGTTYTVTVSIVANSGRALSRSVLLPVILFAAAPATDTAIQTDTGLALTDQNGNPVLAP